MTRTYHHSKDNTNAATHRRTTRTEAPHAYYDDMISTRPTRRTKHNDRAVALLRELGI